MDLVSRAHLHAGLGQVDLERHLLAHEDVLVARFGEQRLEHVELRACESGPLAPLLTGRRCNKHVFIVILQ